MKRNMKFIALAFLLSLPCYAQARLPHIGYVYPAGGQQGSVFNAAIGGQFLDRINAVCVTGGGVEIEILEHILPETSARIKAAMEKAEQEKMRGQQTEGSETKPEIKTTLKKRITTFKQQPNVQLEENMIIRVTVAPDARCGSREIRIITAAGISNPLFFRIGGLPESREKEPNDEVPNPSREIVLPSVINGQILPGDVDLFRIKAVKGQSLVFEMKARELIPYLADTVPGWFQALIKLTDSEGREVAFADDYRFNPDPVAFCEVPEDGEYILEIRDALYRGREDFVYRVTAGELPFITGFFPLGGTAGKKTSVKVQGKNLPSDSFTVNAGTNAPETCFDMKNKNEIVSNPVRFAIDSLPDKLEKEPNNGRIEAQTVSLPALINGRIQEPGDVDAFGFAGKAGQKIVVEVNARRLNSPLDSIVRLIDDYGKQLMVNDDCEDKSSDLITHHADSYMAYELPSDGNYFVELGDVQNKGGGEYAYRLRIGPPQPDFALYVLPSGLTMAAGSSAVITVHAVRKDGFDGEIKLSAESEGGGFTLNDALISGKEDKAELTITSHPDAPPGFFSPRITGTAVISGRELKRNAVPADEAIQAFSYKHFVPVKDFFVAVSSPAEFTLSVDIPNGERAKIPKNGTININVGAVRRSGDIRYIRLVLQHPPQGIKMAEAGIPDKIKVGKITLSADKEAEVGFKGSLILTGMAWFNNRRYTFIAPAIPFEVVD